MFTDSTKIRFNYKIGIILQPTPTLNYSLECTVYTMHISLDTSVDVCWYKQLQYVVQLNLPILMPSFWACVKLRGCECECVWVSEWVGVGVNERE